ncbi:hypothetical protein [Eupransor demetentiae]|uniref:Lipoprotein n=1 Tax=Eupransor demetentiae TaxID=3109584 RepID=A0ABM9N5J0_9LACO|nr:hypothetical protein R54876_GBNLAHCA_01034 [Lactobacillaceae bacterium LMG 33000]
MQNKIYTILATAAVTIVAVVGVLYYIGDQNSSDHHPQKEERSSSSSQESSSSSSSSEKSDDDADDNSDDDEIKQVQAALIGNGFDLRLTDYDGVPVEEAMKKPGSPQNLVHDGIKQFYFQDDHVVRHTGLGMYVGGATGHYQIQPNKLIITYAGGASFTVPYNVDGDNVNFEPWTTSGDGHSYTYNFVSDPNAKAYIDSKPMQD